MIRRLFASPNLDRLGLAVLGLALWIRYPSHFLASAPYLMDFNVYYAVAHRVLAGAAAQLYLPTTSNSDMMVFKYAPVWALVCAPLAWLTPQTAAILWTTFNLLALLATLALGRALARRAGLNPWPLLGVLAVLMILRPLGEEMGNGQVNLLWSVLVAAFLYAAATNRLWTAAWALAGAILLKLPALIFLPYLVCRRQSRLAIRTVMLAAALTVVSSALLHPAAPLQLISDWCIALARNGSAYAFEIGNQSFLALLGRLFTSDGYGLNVLALPRPALAWLALGVLGGVSAAIAWPSRTAAAPGTARWLYEIATLGTVMVIFSPSCTMPSYTALALPIYVALAALGEQLQRRRIDPVSAALAAIGFLMMLLTHKPLWRAMRLMVWRGEAYVYLVFMVLPWFGVALTALLWRQLALTERAKDTV